MSLKTTVELKGEAAAVDLPRSLSSIWRPGTGLSVTPLGAEGALLLRDTVEADGFIAGSLASLSATELFALVVSGVRSGTLVYSHGAVRKTVSFKDGEVVFATSTEPWERLGSLLVTLGLITREQLHAALTEVEPGVRLGQVLTRNGLLSATRLYSGMTYVVREIVLNLFTESEGNLLFLENAPPSEDVLKLPDATRDLVLQGIQRGEEVARLRTRLPPELRVAQGREETPEHGRAVWTKAARGADLRALRPTFEGSEHAWLSLVDELLASGVLAVRPRTEPELELEQVPSTAAPPTVLQKYELLFETICAALQSSGQELDDLRSFLDDPSPGLEKAFEGVTLSDEGRLDIERLLANGAGAEALDAFASYALFSARNVLPPGIAEALSAEFRRIQEGRDDRR
ncbi:MAG: DUF4388 domain-containing protein [Myxococcaceae bacterium]